MQHGGAESAETATEQELDLFSPWLSPFLRASVLHFLGQRQPDSERGAWGDRRIWLPRRSASTEPIDVEARFFPRCRSLRMTPRHAGPVGNAHPTKASSVPSAACPPVSSVSLKTRAG